MFVIHSEYSENKSEYWYSIMAYEGANLYLSKRCFWIWIKNCNKALQKTAYCTTEEKNQSHTVHIPIVFVIKIVQNCEYFPILIVQKSKNC